MWNPASAEGGKRSPEQIDAHARSRSAYFPRENVRHQRWTLLGVALRNGVPCRACEGIRQGRRRICHPL